MTLCQSVYELMNRLETTGFIYEASEMALRSILLGIPSRLPTKNLFSSTFTDDYEPGTFTVDERRQKPPFICVEDDSSLEEWIIKESQQDLVKVLPRLESVCPWQLPSQKEIGEIPHKTLEVLEHRFDGEHKLSEEIYQQEYTDVFRRINLIYLTGWPKLPFNEYDAVNHHLFPLGIELARRAARLDLSTLLKASAVAGLVGLNHKTNASATSLIYKKSVISTNFDAPLSVTADGTYTSLLEKCQEEWAIDGENQFFDYVLCQSQPNHLIFFPDDLLETIIDLKLMESLLDASTRLTICAVPRAVRMGNDAGAQDIYRAMQEDVFSRLLQFHGAGRFQINSNGPLSGNVNGRKMSAAVVELIQSADNVYAKGARSFECLQGLKKDSFYGFAVCRSISESVTGVDAESGRAVLVYQEAGQKSFDGFRRRHLRSVQFPSGRRGWLASKVVLDQPFIPTSDAPLLKTK